MSDRFNLSRFIDAQVPVIEEVRRELSEGRKRTHWMWFVFPQIGGLGNSPMARHYAITSLAEAAAYMLHPVLGSRLVELTRLVNEVEGRTAHEVFGSPDDMKFHSSMTLFSLVKTDEPEFRKALEKYFDGEPDHATMNKLTQL